jgi:hypothetical protein
VNRGVVSGRGGKRTSRKEKESLARTAVVVGSGAAAVAASDVAGAAAVEVATTYEVLVTTTV